MKKMFSHDSCLQVFSLVFLMLSKNQMGLSPDLEGGQAGLKMGVRAIWVIFSVGCKRPPPPPPGKEKALAANITSTFTRTLQLIS